MAAQNQMFKQRPVCTRECIREKHILTGSKFKCSGLSNGHVSLLYASVCVYVYELREPAHRNPSLKDLRVTAA